MHSARAFIALFPAAVPRPPTPAASAAPASAPLLFPPAHTIPATSAPRRRSRPLPPQSLQFPKTAEYSRPSTTAPSSTGSPRNHPPPAAPKAAPHHLPIPRPVASLSHLPSTPACRAISLAHSPSHPSRPWPCNRETPSPTASIRLRSPTANPPSPSRQTESSSPKSRLPLAPN